MACGSSSGGLGANTGMGAGNAYAKPMGAPPGMGALGASSPPMGATGGQSGKPGGPGGQSTSPLTNPAGTPAAGGTSPAGATGGQSGKPGGPGGQSTSPSTNPTGTPAGATGTSPAGATGAAPSWSTLGANGMYNDVVGGHTYSQATPWSQDQINTLNSLYPAAAGATGAGQGRRGQHPWAGKDKHIERQMMWQYGGNWQQAMQNQQAFTAAEAQDWQYTKEGRISKDPNKIGGLLLDGKPYIEPDRADMSTYASYGAKPLDPNAGLADAADWEKYGYGGNKTPQQRPINPGQGPMAAQQKAALEAQYKAQDPNWHPGMMAPDVYAANKAIMDYYNTVDPYSNWTMNSVGDLLKPEHSGTAPWDPAYQAWLKDPANAAAIAKSKAYAANPTPIDGYMSNYAGNGTYSFDKVPPAPSATGHKRGGLLSLINKR